MHSPVLSWNEQLPIPWLRDARACRSSGNFEAMGISPRATITWWMNDDILHPYGTLLFLSMEIYGKSTFLTELWKIHIFYGQTHYEYL